MKDRLSRGACVLLILPFVLLSATSSMSQEFEASPTLQASKILPPSMVRGKYHTVSELVQNDGVMNRYTLRTPQGALVVVGTDRLDKRIGETAALQRMEKVKSSKVFGDALKKSITAPVKFAGNLVTKPVDTVKDVGSGVGDFFNSVGHSLFGGASEKESGAVATVLGYDVIKRKFAFQFGVDPYSTNKLMQERLGELSRAAFVGGIPMKVATAAMTEAAGAAIRATGMAHGLSKLVRDKSPAELKEINGRKLARMGVKSGTATMFLEHPHYSPAKKTIIVHMLESMQGVAGRETFVRQAALVRDEPMAFFMQEQAKSMAGYHRRVARVASIIQLRGLAFMRRSDGALVGVFPVDHLAWRASAAKTVAGLEQEIDRMSGVTGKEVWVTGTMSPLYRKNTRARKWTVHEGARDKLRMP